MKLDLRDVGLGFAGFGGPLADAAALRGDYMRGDSGESFPYVRRRGPVALIGLSTSLPTLPLAATGTLHRVVGRRLEQRRFGLGADDLQ